MRATPDVARAGPTSARRRRERRIRSFFRHEQVAIKMAVVTAQHHSAQRCCSIATQTDDSPASSHAATAASPMVEYMDPAPVSPAPVFGYVAPAPVVTDAAPTPVVGYVAPAPAGTDAAPTLVVGYVAPTPAVTYEAPAPVVGYDAPAPAVTYAAPAPVIDFVAPAPSVTFAAPAPVIGYVATAPSVTFSAPAPVFEYVTPAPVFGFIAPAPAGSFVAPSQQLRPAYTDDAAVVVSASQVVGSLPHGKVFAAPVFHQFHHVPLAGGGIPENLVEIPVVVARRPPPLVDVRPSSCAQRHIMEDLGELAPSVQLLDLPVPQMVENVTDTLLRILDFPIAEQVIAVPTVSCASCPSRSRVPGPQSADQLVEVPTVLTPTRIALQIAEQIVDTPVPRAHDHGSLPGQSSSSRREDERAEVPKIRLLLRMGTDSMRYRVSPLQPLRYVFRAYCRRLGLQESQLRFHCDGLLSPEFSPALLGLEDGDVIDAEEVFEEEEEEEEDDDDHDEFDGTVSRFPEGFLPMRMCRWFPSGNCRHGWGCMFAHSVSELHPLSPEYDS